MIISTRVAAAATILTAIAILAAPAVAQQHENPDVGITLPEGFTATVFADDVGYVRHLAVTPDGILYSPLCPQRFWGAACDHVQGGGVLAMRDSDGDGVADEFAQFGADGGTGVELIGGYLYIGTNTEVIRYRLTPGQLAPADEPEKLITGFPRQFGHVAKGLAFDGAGHLYVSIGAPSNVCDSRRGAEIQTPPCAQLTYQAGIWRFDANKVGQTQKADGHRYATGIRNGAALAWNAEAAALFFATHGRDGLSSLWPDFYSDAENAELPSEEFHRADDGSNHGWPYTYWDQMREQRMVTPEYGGDGKTVSDNPEYRAPLIGFPGHWAPNGLEFYTGDAFPESYQGGAFLAFHGSWNRMPLPQGGYKVVFIPFADGAPTGEWSVFADGFAGKDPLFSPNDAAYRPTGLAVGPDGALYIGADKGGRIWRVTYEGGGD